MIFHESGEAVQDEMGGDSREIMNDCGKGEFHEC
jgi:hypothetical protein